MTALRPSRIGYWFTLLTVLTLGFFAIQAVGSEVMAATTTTTTHTTRTRVTTTLTETTTATASTLGSRGFIILVILLGAAASLAVVGGYLWGKRRTRKILLGAK